MRLELTRKTDLALLALRSLYRTGRRMAASELAESISTTRAFLPQALSPLIRQGWVGSQTGPSGGYELAVDLSGVSILDVIEAIDGPVETGHCVLRGGPCGESAFCSLHEPWSRARAAMAGELARTPVVWPR